MFIIHVKYIIRYNIVYIEHYEVLQGIIVHYM